MLQDIRSYFREMNVSEQLADAMLRIEPDKVRLLKRPSSPEVGMPENAQIATCSDGIFSALSWSM